MGFCVARTKKGRGRLKVWPAAVTWPSCIASRSAACVFGGVRLISSAKTTWANSGPCTNRKLRRPVSGSSSTTSVPVMSPGMRSGVNWTRLNERSSASASVRMRSVLARPGTPTRRTCPRARSATTSPSTASSCPTTTRPTSRRRTRYASARALTAEGSVGSMGIGRGGREGGD